MNFRSFAILFSVVFGASVIARADAMPNRPVATLDLQRYSGQWHEIARLPMFFQRNCVGEVTARYTLQPGGDIEVRNACLTKSGKRDESIGVAKPVPGKPGQLKVRFAPRLLSWVPGVWADYWVIALDADYRWAVVGGPSRDYLWILSRDATMDPAQFDEIVAKAKTAGYPVEKLLRSDAPRARNAT